MQDEGTSMPAGVSPLPQAGRSVDEDKWQQALRLHNMLKVPSAAQSSEDDLEDAWEGREDWPESGWGGQDGDDESENGDGWPGEDEDAHGMAWVSDGAQENSVAPPHAELPEDRVYEVAANVARVAALAGVGAGGLQQMLREVLSLLRR